MIPVFWCDECRAFVTRTPFTNPKQPGVEITTLMDCPDPLDSNDTFHWECFFCGFSKPPAEWTSFFGVPTGVQEPGELRWPDDGKPRDLFSVLESEDE